MNAARGRPAAEGATDGGWPLAARGSLAAKGLLAARVPLPARAPRARGRRPMRGFTLLELLIAVTLMSVLALMSWRALDALIDARERITRAGDELRALVVAYAQIEEDLRRSWPVRLLDTGRGPVALAESPGGRDTTTGGQLDLIREAPAVAAFAPTGLAGGDPSRASGLQRVVWRLEGGRLERGFVLWWPGSPDALADTAFGARSTVDATTWQPLVERVDAISWRLYRPGQGWLPPGQRVDGTGDSVTGVELSLVRGGERLVRVFSIRD